MACSLDALSRRIEAPLHSPRGHPPYLVSSIPQNRVLQFGFVNLPSGLQFQFLLRQGRENKLELLLLLFSCEVMSNSLRPHGL